MLSPFYYLFKNMMSVYLIGIETRSNMKGFFFAQELEGFWSLFLVCLSKLRQHPYWQPILLDMKPEIASCSKYWSYLNTAAARAVATVIWYDLEWESRVIIIFNIRDKGHANLCIKHLDQHQVDPPFVTLIEWEFLGLHRIRRFSQKIRLCLAFIK